MAARRRGFDHAARQARVAGSRSQRYHIGWLRDPGRLGAGRNPCTSLEKLDLAEDPLGLEDHADDPEGEAVDAAAIEAVYAARPSLTNYDGRYYSFDAQA